MIRIVICLNLCVAVLASYVCSKTSSLHLQRRPIYDFSLRILDRVSQETDGHFAFSPLSTWLQLTTLAEGAGGGTRSEMRKVTGEVGKKCFRNKMKLVLNHMGERLKPLSRRCGVIVLDKVFMVKKSFKKNVEKLKGTRVMSFDYRDSGSAADRTNSYISSCTNDSINEAVYSSDFNQYAVLMAVDVAYFKSDWKYPFNAANTKPEPFYAETFIGKVNMMHSVAYFRIADVPYLNARVLELPCAGNEVSLLAFLPNITPKRSVRDFFNSLKKIRLATIFNSLKKRLRLVNVKLPRFKITTDMDNLPELVYDMGVKSIFYPQWANFTAISDYDVYTSLMSQVTDIEVTETGVTARSFAKFLVQVNRTVAFTANRPFVFMVVDRKTDIILYAGSYNEPELF